MRGKEGKIQKEIADAINGTGLGRCWVAISGLLKSPDGKRFVRALPEGFPDLFGYRKADGKMFFIEVKTASGGTLTMLSRFSDMSRGICCS